MGWNTSYQYDLTPVTPVQGEFLGVITPFITGSGAHLVYIYIHIYIHTIFNVDNKCLHIFRFTPIILLLSFLMFLKTYVYIQYVYFYLQINIYIYITNFYTSPLCAHCCCGSSTVTDRFQCSERELRSFKHGLSRLSLCTLEHRKERRSRCKTSDLGDLCGEKIGWSCMDHCLVSNVYFCHP